MRTVHTLAAFDGAFCFGNSFGYMVHEETLNFLGAVNRCLRPGARFVLEMFRSLHAVTLSETDEGVGRTASESISSEAPFTFIAVFVAKNNLSVIRRASGFAKTEVGFGIANLGVTWTTVDFTKTAARNALRS